MAFDDRMHDDAVDRWRAAGIRGLQLGEPNAQALMRTLCKIAHAFAVAELGWGKFRPLLTDEILGGATLGLNYYVGNSFITREICERNLDQLHAMWWRVESFGTKAFFVLTIQLFSLIGMPAYDVVAGVAL
jgi:hypothetical protein